MDATESWLAGPLGPVAAILTMALTTYGCRIAGVLIMQRVRLTPFVERALAALPGSIVAATVVPLALRSGPPAIAGIVAGLAVMVALRREVVALAIGLAVAAGARAMGL